MREVLLACLQHIRPGSRCGDDYHESAVFFFLFEITARRWLGRQELTAARRGRERWEDVRVAFIGLARPFYATGRRFADVYLPRIGATFSFGLGYPLELGFFASWCPK
jgi:hypothetical protein